jgi:hypothetical protein
MMAARGEMAAHRRSAFMKAKLSPVTRKRSRHLRVECQNSNYRGIFMVTAGWLSVRIAIP